MPSCVCNTCVLGSHIIYWANFFILMMVHVASFSHRLIKFASHDLRHALNRYFNKLQQKIDTSLTINPIIFSLSLNNRRLKQHSTKSSTTTTNASYPPTTRSVANSCDCGRASQTAQHTSLLATTTKWLGSAVGGHVYRKIATKLGRSMRIMLRLPRRSFRGYVRTWRAKI